ncbi:MAG: hypothetical protein WBM78_21580 [Desulfobacterales bacterium]
MQAKTDKTFDDLVAQFLGKRLPDEMAASFSISKRHLKRRTLSCACYLSLKTPDIL